jgi:hypothetical protein
VRFAVGDVLELSTSRCLWVVLGIGEWDFRAGGTAPTYVLGHAAPEEKEKWPGFRDEGTQRVIDAIAKEVPVSTHPCGCVWAMIEEDSPVSPDATDDSPEGVRGYVRLKKCEESS